MVRRHFALLFAVSMAMACQELETESLQTDESSPERRVLTATLEADRWTKSLMDPKPEGDGYKVFWAPEDQVYVFTEGVEEEAIFYLTSGEGTTTGKFMGYGKGAVIESVSPYLLNDKTFAEKLPSNGRIRVRIPYLQTYTPQTADPALMFMAAKSNDWNLSYKHLMSYLKIPVKGNHTLTSIELHANDGKDVQQFWYNKDDIHYYNRQLDILWDDMGNPFFDTSSEQPDRMFPTMIDCAGLTLDQEDETEVVLAVIPQVFYGGLTITFNTLSGSMSKTITSDFAFERGKVHETEVVDVRINEELEPSSSLKGIGTESNPFLIGSLKDLLYFSNRINRSGGTIRPAGGGDPVPASFAYYKQTADISLSSICGDGIGDWNPIANANMDESICFYGFYDGAGHKITDLWINKTGDSENIGNYALFGQVGGTIANLEVIGVCGTYSGNSALLCANLTQQGHIVNCVTRGESVSMLGNAAGMVFAANAVEDCVNYALVGTSQDGWMMCAAGIVCCSEKVSNCQNYGEVRAFAGNGLSSGSGIVTSAEEIINCFNSGTVSATAGAAGISYGVFRNDPRGPIARVVNCVNSGSITSNWNANSNSTVASGILGLGMGGEINNCLNTGTVSGATKTKTASVLGYAPVLTSFSYCYGLYDNGEGNPNIVSGGYFSPTNYAILERGELQGLSVHSSPLYTDNDGEDYGFVLDALNAWAAENRTDSETYLKWVRTDSESYPILSSLPASMPGVSEIFQALRRESFLTSGNNTFSTTIISSTGFQIVSTPDWVHLSATNTETISANWTQHTSSFNIDANSTENEREGIIVFSNGMEATETVTIHQAGCRPFPGDWMERALVRKSLLAVTCATWCGNCPRLLCLAAEVQAAYPGTMEVAVLHSETSDLAFAGTSKVRYQYGVNAIPTGLLNFSETLTPSSDLESLLVVQQQTEATTGIDVGSILDGRSAHIEPRIFLKEGGNYKISVWLLEDDIVSYQSDYVNGSSDSFDHDNTVFHSATSVLGEVFSGESGEIVEKRYDVTITSSHDTAKTRILVFVWKQNGGGDYLVDNCVSVQLGENSTLLLQ